MKGVGILLLFTCLAAAQGTDAALSGTVADQTGAAVPGATVTVTNTRTGVEIASTANNAGVYLFPSLLPGVYRIQAGHAGFKKYVLNEVSLGLGERLTINLPMELGAVAESIEVASRNEALATATATVGGLLTERSIQQLPLISRDALGLTTTQPGTNGTNFNGAQRVALNITLDGINVQDNRINSGVFSTLFTSVDRIEEVQVITSPVDAEFGRGSGQIILNSRGGSNQFVGSAFEQLRNTALNANSFFNNLQGLQRPILIRNQFGVRLGGPIRKNKTFFHFLFESSRIRQNSNVTRTVYTPTARQGIFRYFPGAQNANANSSSATVDAAGNPVRPASATGGLQAVSLFGRDPNRAAPDPTGTIAKDLALIPLPNNFRVGDGLNTAGYTFKLSIPDDLTQYDFRIDHYFTPTQRLSVTYNLENESNANGFMASPFPGVPGGDVTSKTRVLSVQVLSNLTPSTINEFRVGFQRPLVRFHSPWEANGTDYLPKLKGQPYLLVLSQVTDPLESSNDPQGRISPVYQFSDKISRLQGKHALKAGVEMRYVSTNGFNSFSVMPRVNAGSGGLGAPQNITAIAGIGTNAGLAQGILNDLSGSVNSVVQAFNAPGGPNPQFLAGEGKQRVWKTREFSWYFQDDFKVARTVTLNLGLRYEFYGSPFDGHGRTANLVGGSGSVFGVSGNSFASVFRPGVNEGSLTRVQLVARESPNPDIPLFNPDKNNFAPSIGLAWNVPTPKWLGRWPIVFRAGYAIAYERFALRLVDVLSGDQPGLREARTFTTGNVLNVGNASLPLSPLSKPLDTVPITDRSQTVRTFDSNIRAPYIQNWNAGFQTKLSNTASLSARYVASKGTRLILGADVNEANVFENGIVDAFRITQAGGNAPLITTLFRGLNVPGVGVVDGVNITGSDAVRRNTTTNAFLAANDVGGFASFLNTNTFITNVRGGIPRRAGFPENWITANPQFANARLTGNYANSIFHSLQVQVDKRFSKGFLLLSNYTYGKAFGEEEGDAQEQVDNYRTLRNRALDRRILAFSLKHIIRNSGIWELPFGKGKPLLGNAKGLLQRLAGGWQTGYIFNVFSGSPLEFGVNSNTFNNYGGATALALAPIANGIGGVTRTGNGVVFFPGYKVVTDPQVNGFDSAFAGRSTMRAIADPSGKIILANPLPGTLGNIGQRVLNGPGTFRLDVNLLKTIAISERRNFVIRADAINLSNTPQFGNPNMSINSLNFGNITSAGGTRVVTLEARLNF
ncbi:MAG: carboxypeptidase regulatory-like domain-containing protein [Candidatus Solibacter usitatus]|nr:carboxypeptidase regulatory-like domain-containing protein [Candidatus Solibacter usitatus]